MKECEKYAALLDAFSEGDLFMEDMVQVQTHLMNCPACQAYLEDLLAIRAAFPTVEDTEVPEGFADRVKAAVAATPQSSAPAATVKTGKAKKAPWGRVLASLAACCAIVILMKTPIFGGSHSKEAASTVSYSATETAVVTEETAAEEPTAYAVETTEATPAEPEMAVMDTTEFAAKEDAKQKGSTEDGTNTAMGTLTADTAAPEEAEAPMARDGTEFLLTAAEAGDLLKDFTPVAETDAEVYYELSAHEYTGLLMALPRETRQSAPANAAETITVIVQK